MFYHLCSLLQDFVLFCFWSSAAAILLTFIFYFEAAYNTGFGYDWVILAFTYSLPSEIGSHMLLPGHVLCLPHQWWFNMIYSIPPSSSCQSSYRKLPKLAYAAPDVPNKGLLSFLLKLCKNYAPAGFTEISILGPVYGCPQKPWGLTGISQLLLTCFSHWYRWALFYTKIYFLLVIFFFWQAGEGIYSIFIPFTIKNLTTKRFL